MLVFLELEMKITSIGLAGGIQLNKNDNLPFNLTAEEQIKLYRYLKYTHFPKNPTIFQLKEESEIVW